MADQALSSASNVAVSVLVAREASARGFGGFSLVFLAYTLVLGVTTAAASDPLLVSVGDRSDDEVRAAGRATTGLGLLAGVVSGVVVLAASLTLPSSVRGGAVALALTLPLLLAQDAVRAVLFARGRPDQAALIDGVWAVCQAIGFGVLFLVDAAGAGALVAVWGAGAGVAAIVGCIREGMVPSMAAGVRWVQEHARLSGSLTVDFLAMTGAAYVAIGVATAVAGLAAAAALRGAQLLFGPLVVLTSGLKPFVLREATRDRPGMMRLVTRLSIALAAVSAAWTVLLLVLPDSLGAEALGDSWDAARDVVPWIGLAIIARGASTVPAWCLRVLSAGRRILRARALDASVTVLFGGVGAAVGGAAGAAGGMAAANAVAAGAWWSGFRAAARAKAPT